MENSSKNLADRLRELCECFSFNFDNTDDDFFKVSTGEIDGITLFLNLDEEKVRFYYLIRTHDVVYSGDRSDIHIVISLMLASFLKVKSNISCSLFDIPHPVVDDEIWGRYIYPTQYNDENSNSIQFAENLVKTLFEWRELFWELIGCPCEECLSNENLSDKRIYDIEPELIDYRETLSRYNIGGRIRPQYSIVYDIENDITIIKSEILIKYLNLIISLFEYKPNKINGVNGDIYINSSIYNLIKHQDLNELEKIIHGLQSSSEPNSNLILIDNFIIIVNSNYIIAKSIDSGLEAFKKEKEIIRERHNNEASILFPIPIFEWINDPCPIQFELLVKSLLERDPQIRKVRIAAPTNQGDKGRDLIIDWEILDKNQVVTNKKPPTSIYKIVGQCKASNKSIGKSKVTDIRDTIENHDANGFFLAVSTQITNPLTETLEKLNQKGYWTDWWNRDDIEFRLNQHQDLIIKFDKVLRIKKGVKIVIE